MPGQNCPGQIARAPVKFLTIFVKLLSIFVKFLSSGSKMGQKVALTEHTFVCTSVDCPRIFKFFLVSNFLLLKELQKELHLYELQRSCNCQILIGAAIGAAIWQSYTTVSNFLLLKKRRGLLLFPNLDLYTTNQPVNIFLECITDKLLIRPHLFIPVKFFRLGCA